MFVFLLSALLEELDFLYQVCLTALFSNRFVKFGAVLDNNGKLIIAEYRKGIQNYWERRATNIPGVFLLKLPSTRTWQAAVAIEVNPIDVTGSATKKRRHSG